jgi:ABC-2 type transport system permease protein
VDALYGERRDRSILFWKSMPVSDSTAVLSKILIPLVVLPGIAIVLSVVVQALLMVLGVPVFLAHGMSPTLLWREFEPVQDRIIMIYGLGAHVLWYSPLYAWLLLISAWARRAPMIWAILPPVAVVAMERMAFGTAHFGNFIRYRVVGAMSAAFTAEASNGNVNELADLDFLKFFSSPGLWSGLVFAGLFLAAAVRLRRNREPI